MMKLQTPSHYSIFIIISFYQSLACDWAFKWNPNSNKKKNKTSSIERVYSTSSYIRSKKNASNQIES